MGWNVSAEWYQTTWEKVLNVPRETKTKQKLRN